LEQVKSKYEMETNANNIATKALQDKLKKRNDQLKENEGHVKH
jgi:hypothetical protein